MTDRNELEIRRRIQAAMDSDDARAELQARRELSSVLGGRVLPGGGEMATRAAERAGIDTETGLPFTERAALSVKMTPEGRQGYLAAQYGAENVSRLPDGRFVVRQPGGDWQTVEESGLALADIADIAGPAVEAVPPIATGFATANPAAVAAASGAGNVLRQGISAMLPGEDEMTLAERATQAGVATALGGASQFGANRLAQAADALRPHNLIARSVQRSMESPHARRGAAISQRTGVDFTPGTQTGSRGQLTVEGLVRRHPASADIMQQMDEASTNQAHTFIRNLQQRVNPTGAGAITAGGEVGKGFRQAVDSAVRARSSQWTRDFAPVVSAAGDTKIIPLVGTRNTIQQIIDDFDVPGGGDVAATLVSRLRNVAQDLEAPLTARQTQRLLQIYGRVARGQGQLFKDIDNAQQREIGRRVFSAMQRDLDDFAEGGVQGDAIVDALRQARANWRQNSQAIDELEASTLGRIFGGRFDPAPERVADKFLSMRGTEVRQAANILDQNNPQAMDMIRGHMIEEALRKSTPAASSADTVAFSPAKFGTFLKNHAEQFQSAFLASKQNAALGHLKMAYEAAGRLANRAGTEGSPTAPLMLAWDMAQSAFTANPVGLARNTVTMLTPRRMARILATPAGRSALITLNRTKPGTRAATNAGLVITGILQKENMMNDAEQASETPQQ